MRDDHRREHRELWWESPTVELGTVVHLDLEAPFRAERGGELAEIQVSYESWGQLAERRDNAVLIIHPLASDCHATGGFAGESEGWWEALVGPGRPIDTDKLFVVCPNLLGGCYGTTGPRFPAGDGAPYHFRFPLLTPRDMMRVQRLFLEKLGIARVRMVIGPSMGGMVAWEWAIEASDAVDQVVVVAAPLRSTPYQIGLNWLQRRGIELDIDQNEVVAKFGQMLARGVGMLSYRSPAGLEEKFGREFFQEPGATLGERGMFNIESWLRHHGKRITRRFDPYTYLLFSRAMDLHDVAAGRGDLLAALDRVRCRVVVIGISTDHLYTPQEVHLGAEILNHLGRDVHYAEIRSPHGHDAFLLETAQLGSIVGDLTARRSFRTARRREPPLRDVRIGILGAGRVAAAFVRLAREREPHLSDVFGLRLEIAGVAEIDREKKLDPIFDGIAVSFDPAALIERPDLDVIVELTRGLGAAPLIERALARRRPVVTPNKPLIREHGRRLERLAFENGVRIAYHDAIAAGWPLMYALDRPLGRGDITEIEAVLSSACNLILDRMAEGSTFEGALAEAVAKEATEPDPDLDLSGWDTAQKLAILLTRAVSRRFAVDDLTFDGIRDLDPGLVRGANDLGFRVKLVALARIAGAEPRAIVCPMAVAAESHLGSVRGTNHVVVLRTPEAGDVVHAGPGVGTLPVATAVLNDLLGLCDPRHSWTGRFPAAARPVPPISFEGHLIHDGTRCRVVDSPCPGSIPICERS